MVTDVARLTRSVRESVLEETLLHSPALSNLDEEVRRLQTDLDQKGFAEFTDESGRRFRVSRKPA